MVSIFEFSTHNFYRNTISYASDTTLLTCVIKYVGFQENPPPPIYREYLRIGASRMNAVYTIR